MTLKFYEVFQQQAELVSTGRSIYSIGETPEECSFGILCFMHYLNSAFPDQYHFDPFIEDDNVTVRYYRNGENVNKTLAMMPAEEYPKQNWLYNNMHN